jgi:hypothetical protein
MVINSEVISEKQTALRMGASTFWNLMGLSRHVMGLL